MPTYALLDPTLTSVLGVRNDIDPTLYAAWVASGNPKATRLRVVNMIAQPAFDPATQSIAQTGWTISPSDVQPIWAIQVLSAAQQALVVNQSNRLTLINNALTALSSADANWATLTALQKDTVLRHLLKVTVILLNQQAALFQATG